MYYSSRCESVHITLWLGPVWMKLLSLGWLEAQNKPILCFAFSLILMTSKCGLYCCLRQPGNKEWKQCLFPSDEFYMWPITSHMTSRNTSDKRKIPDNNNLICSLLSLFTICDMKQSFLDASHTLFFFFKSPRLFKNTNTAERTLFFRKKFSRSQKVTNIRLNEKSVSRTDAKDTGEAAFVLNKSRLSRLSNSPDLCRLSESTQGCTYKSAPTGLSSNLKVGIKLMMRRTAFTHLSSSLASSSAPVYKDSCD